MQDKFPTHTGAALLNGGGAAFRVWAPHAEAVSVAGDFNNWNAECDSLSPQDGGIWEGTIDNVEVGAEYKFVLRTGDNLLWKNDPSARVLTNSAGNSVLYDDTAFDWEGDSEFRLPSWNELIIYELHLGTFFRGGEEGEPGSFDDAIQRLDHLVDLGINVIELMPVAEFAGGVSWGYNPAFPYAVESDYGGPDGFKRFVKACHERGIGVILDVVYNHFGPSDLDMWQFDGWSENGLGGIYFYNDWRANTPWGDTRPDFGRNEVRQYIHDNAMMWLREYHVDGLRFDMTFYMRSVRDGEDIPEGWSLAQWINQDLAQTFPGKITLAEDLRSNEWLTKKPEEGGAGFGAQWDEQFVHPVRRVLSIQEDDQRSMAEIVHSLTFNYNGDPFQRVVYTESHDEVANGKSRVPSEVDEVDQEGFWARKWSALGACLVMTAPGIPMIFQGQELLATGHFDDGVEMDWEKGHRHPGMVRFYRDLIHLRGNRNEKCEGLRDSSLEILHANDESKVVAFLRGTGEGQALVVMNFSCMEFDEYSIGVPESGDWELVFHADAHFYSEDFGDKPISDVRSAEGDLDGKGHRLTVSLGSYDCLIFHRRGA